MEPQHGPPGLVWPGVRRFWRVTLALTAGLGVALAFVLSTADVRTYERTARYLVTVPAAQGEDAALVSINTDRVARDYAAILQSDEPLLSTLGRRVDRTTDGVRDRLLSAYDPSTSTIQVRYHGRTAAEVRAFFAELDRVLAADGLVSSNVPAGAVRSLQRADQDVITQVDPLRAHPAWGVLAGLLAGVTVAVALERARPRVAGRGHLQSLTDRPVVEVPADSREALDALVVRLLGVDPLPARVGVVAADRSVDADAVAAVVVATAAALAAEGALPPAAAAVPVTALSPADAPASTHWLLVVERDRPARAVGTALEALADAEHVLVALLTPAGPDAEPGRPLAEVGA